MELSYYGLDFLLNPINDKLQSFPFSLGCFSVELEIMCTIKKQKSHSVYEFRLFVWVKDDDGNIVMSKTYDDLDNFVRDFEKSITPDLRDYIYDNLKSIFQ